MSFGGVCLTADPSKAAILGLAKRAREHGCRTVFDPNARSDLWDGGFSEAFTKACSHASILKTTPADLREAGIGGPRTAHLDAILERGPDTAVLTLGTDGAVAKTTPSSPWDTQSAEHAGYAVDAVDPTGAGDAFTAGLIRAMADDRSLFESLEFANAVAAVTTTSDGATSASLDMTQLNQLVDGG